MWPQNYSKYLYTFKIINNKEKVPFFFVPRSTSCQLAPPFSKEVKERHTNIPVTPATRILFSDSRTAAHVVEALLILTTQTQPASDCCDYEHCFTAAARLLASFGKFLQTWQRSLHSTHCSNSLKYARHTTNKSCYDHSPFSFSGLPTIFPADNTFLFNILALFLVFEISFLSQISKRKYDKVSKTFYFRF